MDMASFAEWSAAGFPGIIPIVPPDAPLSPTSKIKPEQRGKVPGRKNGQGTWGGFDWLHYAPTERDLNVWDKMGAGVGLLAGQCPGLDIDVLDQSLVELIAATANRVLGPAPKRIGQWPKQLRPYRTLEPFDRIRLWFNAPGSERNHLVEMLGVTNQYVVDGIHPVTRRPYEWDKHPTTLGMGSLTEITQKKAEEFFAELELLLEMFGCTEIEREDPGKGTVDRSKIDQVALEGDIDQIAKAMALIPNTNAIAPTRTDYLRFGYAVKAACLARSGTGV